MRIRTCLVPVLVVLLVGPGCGSDDSSDSDTPLSAKRYAQIESVYQAQLSSDTAETRAEVGRSLKTVGQACDRLDEGDRLLAAIRKTCGETLRALASLTETDCANQQACMRLFRRGIEAFDTMIASAHRADDVIEDAVDDERCRDALSTPPKGYDAFEAMRDAMKDLVDAVESGDQQGGADALERMEKAQKDLGKIGSARKVLSRFRMACGSAA